MIRSSQRQSYARMATETMAGVDMSNRPTTGWQFGSMTTVMRIAVMSFVAMLCLVGFVGAFGLLVTEKKAGTGSDSDNTGAMLMAKWAMDLNDEASITFSSPLIYLDKQDDLPRPSYVQHYYSKSPSKEDPFAAMAQEQLDALAALRSRNLTFIINVIGWRRRASLKRLISSLESARYHGFKTRLVFHLDGEAHPLVKEFVENYEWPHGKTSMNLHTVRLGLESTIVNSWDALYDDQLAFFFEDDIEVSPHYFEYTMLVLHKYIYPDANSPRSDSYLASKMMGVALNTPRFNEIVFPPYRWVPQHEIGQEDYQFAFQLANSWGCLYFPWVWREYRRYHAWRKGAGLALMESVVPDSYINQWLRSWKKSLIELSYIRGYYMIYPNLPGQHGFSIHHREPGEHTSLTGQPLTPEVDRMDDLYLDYFTIPLATNERDVNRLYATMKPLGELPAVNFHHSRVKNIYELAQAGTPAVVALERHGFDFDQFSPNPGCLLDNLSPQVIPDGDEGERYLIYQGQGSAYDQLVALENAFAYARLLGRTLIIPPLTYENKAKRKFQLATWEWLLDLRSLARESPWAPVRLFEEMQDNGVWLDRAVEFRPPAKKHAAIWQFNDKLFDMNGIVPMRSIILPRINGTADGIQKSFGRCHDKYLGFRAMTSAFHYHQDLATDRAFRTWATERLALKREFKDVFDEIMQSIKRPFACAIFTRGDDPGNCGRGITFPDGDLGKLVTYRSCNATAPRTIEYLTETAQRQSTAIQSIYIYTDAGTPPVAIPTSIDGGSIASGRQIPILRSNMLAEAIRKKNILHSDIKHMVQDVQQIFEDRLCAEADVFLGNVFSEFALRVARVRRGLGRPSEMLGYSPEAVL